MPASIRRRRALLLFSPGLLAALAAAGPRASAQQAADAPPWPMVGRDAAHTGSIEGPEAPYRRAWTAPIEGGPVAGPVVTGGSVIAVGARSVVALAPDSGEVLWQWARGGGPAGPPAVEGDLFVHATGTGSSAAVVGRRIEDGREVWRAFTGSAVPGGPVVAQGSVYVGTRGGDVIALDAETGEERWRFEADGAVETSPAVAGGLVLAVAQNLTSGRATVYALDAATGGEEGPVWQFSPQELPSAFSTSVAADDDLAFVGTSDGVVRGLELESGLERWSADARDVFSPRQVPAAPSGDLLISDQVHLYRLDPSSGEERWVYRLADLRALPKDRVNSLAASSPTVSRQAVLIGDTSGRASAVDLESGRLVWTEDLGPGPIGAVAASDDRIFLSSQGEGGAVVALEHDPDGTLLDEVSPTVLFPLRALLNFAAAFVVVGGIIVGLFRFALRTSPREAEEENPEPET